MLNRAATNAYPWWWASHIRTKQSKWLEQNLVDMEEMVQNMLKIIEQEGDSFVKRVEMYYKKRPELIKFVEEAYRAYRALAERYDHLSKDLQNANRTIATSLPEQNNLSSTVADKKDQLRKTASSSDFIVPDNSSGLTKEEAANEIDELQKEILVLQTEREFLKSSYETRMAKYSETEGKISELNARVYSLQDEFGIGTMIEDHEARSIMTSTALTSCSEALNELQEEQAMSINEVKGEFAKIKDAHERLEALKPKTNQDQSQGLESKSFDLIIENVGLEEGCLNNVDCSVANGIDELVQKTVLLETTIVSQNGLLKRLRQYIDELLRQIENLEENKGSIGTNEGDTKRIVELEDELCKVKSINDNLDDLMETLEDVEDMTCSKEEKDEPEAEVETETEHEKEVQDKEMDMRIHDGEVQDLEDSDKMQTNNIEEREKSLVDEYIVILRDYKDNKIKLSEAENKNREYIFELTFLARELRSTIMAKDEEIKLLLRKLNSLQQNKNENVDLESENSRTPKEEDQQPQIRRQLHGRSVSAGEPRSPLAMNKDMKPLFHHLYDVRAGILSRNTSLAESTSRRRDIVEDSPRPMSRVQVRLRTELNDVLEGNLDFWLRFSTSFHQIQKFQTTIKDLQGDISKLRDTKNTEKNNLHSLQSNARSIYKNLREIQNEMSLWMEHSTLFHDELRGRFSSLNNIQEEIVKLLNVEKKSLDPELSDLQAANFQGEIRNMKQENKKVEEELQVGIRRVKELKKETEKVLVKVDKEFKLYEHKSSSNKSKIPLHTFLFGIKMKKNKQRNLTIE